MERVIQKIFTEHFEAYFSTHKLSVREIDAARSFLNDHDQTSTHRVSRRSLSRHLA